MGGAQQITTASSNPTLSAIAPLFAHIPLDQSQHVQGRAFVNSVVDQPDADLRSLSWLELDDVVCEKAGYAFSSIQNAVSIPVLLRTQSVSIRRQMEQEGALSCTGVGIDSEIPRSSLFIEDGRTVFGEDRRLDEHDQRSVDGSLSLDRARDADHRAQGDLLFLETEDLTHRRAS